MVFLAANLSDKYLWSDLNLKDRIQAAIDGGFDFYEFSDPYTYSAESIAEAITIDTHSDDMMQCVMISSKVPADKKDKCRHGYAVAPDKVELFQKSMADTFSYARILKAKFINVRIGVVDETNKKALVEATKTIVSNLQWASRAVKTELEGTCQLLLEVVADVDGYYVCNLDRLMNLLELADCDNLFINLDFGQIQLVHGNLHHVIKKLFPLIKNIQASAPDSKKTPPWACEISYKFIFDFLADLKYPGTVGLLYKSARPLEGKQAHKWMTKFHERKWKKTAKSAGVLATCVGVLNDGTKKPFFLLGRDHKQDYWGFFWGHADETDKDQATTAVRETIEESLGIIGTEESLYAACSTDGLHCRHMDSTLYMLNFGELTEAQMEYYVTLYDKVRAQTVLDNHQAEMKEVRWVDASRIDAIVAERKGPNRLRGFVRHIFKDLLRDMVHFNKFCLECKPLPIKVYTPPRYGAGAGEDAAAAAPTLHEVPSGAAAEKQ